MSTAIRAFPTTFGARSGPFEAVASEATAAALELPSFLAVLSELAATDLGRERCRSLSPLVDLEAFEERRRRFEEARVLLATRRLVGGFEFSVAATLDEVASGWPTNAGLSLVRLADLLGATAEIAERCREPEPASPSLALLAAELPDLKELARAIAKALDRRGEVREDASPKLAQLRGRIRSLRDGLYSQLRRHVDAERDSFSEETIPMRGGRLVLVLAAGARGRVPGLVHGRSATGKSFYFEPIEVVESNNDLQQAAEDEEAERQRILAELLGRAREELEALAAHAAFLGEMDLLQAMGRFAQQADARLAELAPAQALELKGARHPLLDPRLADLRRQALGSPGHEKPIIPLDLELEAERRILVVTGPNAGGKTVVLKTVGLLALLHLCGLPVPAGPGSRLPHLAYVVATVGDEQDLLADRSTFSGRLLRLKEAWEGSGPGSLVLLDELGSGTDPEEGAALSTALLEGLLEKQTLALITTHLTPLAAAALELEGAACAAMEFDPDSGRATYRLLPGPPGGSEAIALARRLGLPSEWLDRAEARLSGEHRNLRRLVSELERTRVELAAERQRLSAETAAAELARARLEREKAALEAERKVTSQRMKTELETFRAETRKKLRDELERLRAELDKGRRRGLLGEAETRLFAAAPVAAEAEPEAPRPVVLGGQVRHRTLGWQGVLEKLSGERAHVVVRGKRFQCELADLEGAGSREDRAERRAGISRPAVAELGGSSELNLIGRRVEEALLELDSYLDTALLAGRNELRVIHGHGTGRLRDAVRDVLRRHPGVASIRPGEANEGGNGATVVSLRAS
ncbi:MAG: Smr/MutS family protein [Thermoanaerobaculia bacterium]